MMDNQMGEDDKAQMDDKDEMDNKAKMDDTEIDIFQKDVQIAVSNFLTEMGDGW